MQRLQTELNIQWQFASQATPSPKAKVTMETLDRSRSDLSYHYDCVIQSLKQLNAHADNARSTDNGNDANSNNECINSTKAKPDAKPVDKKVQIDSGNVEKKGKRNIAIFALFALSFYCFPFVCLVCDNILHTS